MPWPIVIIHPPETSTAARWDSFVGAVVEEGCLGVEERGERQGGCPESAVLTFPETEDADDVHKWRGIVCDLAAAYLPASGSGSLRIRANVLEDQDWNRYWAESYRVAKVSERFWVGPPNEKPPVDLKAKDLWLKIEYGPAFGVGSHATTRLCLRLIEKIKKFPDVTLDIGTGTGILAMAVLTLGGKRALGMDLDNKSREVFRANARHGEFEERAFWVKGSTLREAQKELDRKEWPAPGLILCNMLSATFLRLLPDLAAYKCPIILSGFLWSEREEIAAAVAKHGMKIKEEMEQDDWGAFHLVKK